MSADRDPASFVPLPTAALHVLVALTEVPLHGYGITKAVNELSGGRVRMGPGTLYGSIKKLLGDGLIVESASRPDPSLDDERRRYYRLTDLGRAVCDAELERLRDLVAHVQTLRPRLGGA